MWNTSRQQTQQQQQNSTNSSVNRNLSPGQNQVSGPLSSYISGLLLHPGARLDPMKTAARDSVNSNYGDAWTALRDRMLGSGGTASGKFGTAARSMEVSRAGALSGLEPQFAKMELDQSNLGASLAEQLLGLNFGQTAAGYSSGSGSSDSTTSSSSFSISDLFADIGRMALLGGGGSLGGGAGAGSTPSSTMLHLFGS